MDPSNRLESVLCPPTLYPIDFTTLTPIDWARIIRHLIAFSKQQLKYFPGMQQLEEMLNFRQSNNFYASRRTDMGRITPLDFPIKKRCITLLRQEKKIDREFMNEIRLLLTDTGKLFRWYAEYEYVVGRRGHAEVIHQTALVSRFTPLVSDVELAKSINLKIVQEQLFQTLIDRIIDPGIEDRKRHLEAFQEIRNEATRIRNAISLT